MSPPVTTLARAGCGALLDAFARLFDYPDGDWGQALREAEDHARAVPEPEVPRLVGHFVRAMSELTPEGREELHARTFEMGASCPLYVGVALFGENSFKRGVFLAELSGHMSAAGFDLQRELPDHLGVLLRFAAHLSEEEWRELGRYCLLGPVGRMARGVEDENPYRALLDAVHAALVWTLPGVEAAPLPVEQERGQPPGCAVGAGGCGFLSPRAETSSVRVRSESGELVEGRDA